MLITSFCTIDALLFLTATLFLLYKYTTKNFDYWKKKGIYYIKPVPFFGNAYKIATFKINVGIWLRDLYDAINEPFYGMFMFDEPYLIVQSPELVKHILIKDFNSFVDRTVLAPEHDEIVANMLFMKKSPGWRTLRTKMTPAFSPGKLKGMFSLMNNIGSDMTTYIKRNLGDIDAKDVCAKYSTDVISICAFALEGRSFEDKGADFRNVGKTMFAFKRKTAISQLGYFFFQKWAKLFRFTFFDPWIREYLKSVFWDVIKLREENNIKGNDLIDIIINIRKNDKLCNEIDFEGDKVVAQAVQFFAAGFESTSSSMSFTLYQLSMQPDIQDRLRNEIVDNIKEHGGITYDGVLKMKYLDMCIKETLRMYPILPYLDRRCNTDYNIPGTDVVIDKGTAVYIPMLGLHYDEKYFPNPYVYNPERFSEKYSPDLDGICYMPFGEGPRNCIGERFGLQVAKLGLVHILSEFVVEKSADTPIPVVYEAKSFVLQSSLGIPLHFKQYFPTPA